jgi:hypothetical protein
VEMDIATVQLVKIVVLVIKIVVLVVCSII